jgi:putative transcriptional regulator
MIKYKIDVLQELKNKGYTTYSIRKNKLLNERAMQYLRTGEVVGITSLDKICGLLNLQPGDIIEYIPD